MEQVNEKSLNITDSNFLKNTAKRYLETTILGEKEEAYYLNDNYEICKGNCEVNMRNLFISHTGIDKSYPTLYVENYKEPKWWTYNLPNIKLIQAHLIDLKIDVLKTKILQLKDIRDGNSKD